MVSIHFVFSFQQIYNCRRIDFIYLTVINLISRSFGHGIFIYFKNYAGFEASKCKNVEAKVYINITLQMLIKNLST